MTEPAPAFLLIINPGSTTTKIAVYRELEEVFAEEVAHDSKQLEAFGGVAAQEEYRHQLVREALARHEGTFPKLTAVIGRGGLLRPVPGGVYRVSAPMVAELRAAAHGEHASNLGAILAKRFGDELGIPAFIADPVVVDELCPEARISGMPEIERKSIFHALNHKSVARRVAAAMGTSYEKLNFVVAHLGGGISVAAHAHGRVIDVNNALDGDGPFSPERSGGVPAGQLARLVHAGTFTLPEIQRKLCGKGGVFAYLGTKDMAEAARRAAAGDEQAELILRALAYQVAKEIGALATCLGGNVDAIILTGGLANLKRLTDEIGRRTAHLAPARIVPGEREMIALAENGVAVLRGQMNVQEYR
jgi:butyrate kinase